MIDVKCSWKKDHKRVLETYIPRPLKEHNCLNSALANMQWGDMIQLQIVQITYLSSQITTNCYSPLNKQKNDLMAEISDIEHFLLKRCCMHIYFTVSGDLM
ncbi:hypothetical protein PV325_000618 [Microctonus aethiopoides]|nr:hypothetical protein PV326_000724 [Microctonus aethiopoides]KAK0079941.1 hypothetical protein PV325_000618 [Microctonus aethiopoides]